MKYLLILLVCVVFAGTSSGQNKLSGTFASHDPYNWSSIRFYSDSLFTYACWSCKGGAESKGSYTIKDKFITFHFQGSDTLKSYSTEKITCPPNNSHYFNAYQLRFKKGDTETYTIKKLSSDNIILANEKNLLNFWKKEN